MDNSHCFCIKSDSLNVDFKRFCSDSDFKAEFIDSKNQSSYEQILFGTTDSLLA